MPSNPELLKQIESSLAAYATAPLLEASLGLFNSLGYRSERRMKLRSATAEGFLGTFDRGNTLNAERALLADWQGVEFLFQLTDSEVQTATIGTHELAFDSRSRFEGAEINSYLFLALELRPADSRDGDRRGQAYTRTELAGATRALNRLFDMPALLVFKHGATLSLGIIHRRLSKRDPSKDVLEKVTLIKDIAFADPIRAHLEILNDFALANLAGDFGVSNFVRLHEAWQKRLGSYALSNEFYREIADWYFWAHHQVDDGTIRLPQHCDTEQEKSLFLIRLLTRVIFGWFLVEKRLIPTDLFREHRLKSLLKEFTPSRDPEKPDTASSYYHAILQNLFFGTLNMPPEQRAFRERKKEGERYDPNFGITNLWRYETDFRQPADWLSLAARVPFLNGGLFDCLDDKSGKKKDNFILDGFSDRKDFGCDLPNDLFFGPERTVDLSKDYGEEDKRTARSKKAKVRGLIEILSRYKFTIEENTPLEEEIALDPELLGKVFENLLASYNKDTRTTARKALGAFYTPREIVSYMVDEALKSYLTTQVPRCKGALDDLFSNKATLKEIKPDSRDALIAAIGRVKILDPACGSGAFPMGALHRLVDLLQKLDPNNESWKRDRLAEARRYRQLLEQSGATTGEVAACDARIADIEKSFDTRFHALDFARKLYLIENSIYGVDIQPIATQIAKLRFFISLVVDQKVEPKAPNLGVRPLPNLETRLVAADTLIPIEKAEAHQFDLLDQEIRPLRRELEDVRHEHFNARSPQAKRKCRDRDEELRERIAELLRQNGLPAESATKLARWNPYDQNTYASFFDIDWMFGKEHAQVALAAEYIRGGEGFDIVIGNPPYGAVFTPEEKERFNDLYEHQDYQIDSYLLFMERGMSLLKDGGIQALIVSNTWLPSLMFKKIRGFIFGSTQIVSILDVATKVFAAVVDTTVLIHRKGQPKEDHELGVLSFDESGISHEFCVIQKSWHSADGKPVSIRATPKLQVIISRMERQNALGDFFKVTPGCKPFQVGKGQPPQTREIVDNKPFMSERKKNVSFRPLLRGRLIGRFANYWKDDYWISFGEWLAEPRHTADYDAPNKIVVRQTGDSLIATLDRRQFIVMNNMFTIVPTSERFRTEFALGVINSSASNWFYQTAINPEKGEALAEIKRGHLIRVPIPDASQSQQSIITSLVEMLLEANRLLQSIPSSQTTRDPLMLAYLERVLNGLVYELYFPEEVHGAGLRLFELVEVARLPDVNALPEAERLPRLRQKFEELHDGAHPLRIALDKLQTLDTVRIIEGKA